MTEKSNKKPLHAFEAFGIELEYMIVDAETLKIQTVADKLLEKAAGNLSGDYENGRITWSNELVMHVIEVKSSGPDPDLATLAGAFQKNIEEINQLLGPKTCLLPTGMHPTMHPSEKKLWPHDNNEIYEAYDRIFDCRGHGWSNLQSMHINLPFANDDEFRKLHTAIRFLLPVLPALSASSPIVEGVPTGYADSRLIQYQQNQKRIPSIAGLVIPEPVLSKADYHEKILAKTFADIAPHDPEEMLQEEWLNSRGAIARFDRNAIEIRILDTQECPAVDLAIAELIIAVLKTLYDAKIPFAEQLAPTTEYLKSIFDLTVKYAESANIDAKYLMAWGFEKPMSVKQFWRLTFHHHRSQISSPACAILELLLEEGSLATRISKAKQTRDLSSIYKSLADCLQKGLFFHA